jgi:hypothetical protein
MKGHIRERSPGYWAIVIELRDDVTKHALRNIRAHASANHQRLCGAP